MYPTAKLEWRREGYCDLLALTISTGTHIDSVSQSSMAKPVASSAQARVDRPAVHQVGKVAMRPLEGVKDEPFLPFLGYRHNHDAPTRRSTRLHSASTLGMSGVSNSSRVKHMNIPSMESSA